jgi:3-dehydroquinate synthase
MKTIKVNLGARSYQILIGAGILARCGRIARSLDIGTDAYIITNSYIQKKYGARLASSLRSSGISVRFKLVADTEKSKSLTTASAVLKDLACYDIKKRVFIIAFGGGVAGDLAGFVAAIYKRGIPYIQVPTTLLAQVDSSIGGKTAVDLDQGKNLVGAFYQPRAVIADMALLKSLDKRQLRQGLSEVIKYGLIGNRQLFSYVEKNIDRILSGDAAALSFIVQACSRIKAAVVSADEKEEKSIRTLLNFGHTIGHAIEAGAGYSKYGHGEAVALGMLVAAAISVHMKMLDNGSFERIRSVIAAAGLPVKLQGVPLQKIISLHYRDKKFMAGKNRFVLLQSIGKAKVVDNISLLIIKKSSAPIMVPGTAFC